LKEWYNKFRSHKNDDQTSEYEEVLKKLLFNEENTKTINYKSFLIEEGGIGGVSDKDRA